jgi:hypothetical protein
MISTSPNRASASGDVPDVQWRFGYRRYNIDIAASLVMIHELTFAKSKVLLVQVVLFRKFTPVNLLLDG